MKWIFWFTAALLAYTYLGYPAWLWLRLRLRRRPVKSGLITPPVSIVMVVRNEAGVIERKLRNLLALDYPAGLCEIVVASDGSTDATNEILNYYAADNRIRILVNPVSRGKAACLNDGITAVRGEIVLFTDARQQIESRALRMLTSTFADPEVGCASGELMLADPEGVEHVRGMGLYWQ